MPLLADVIVASAKTTLPGTTFRITTDDDQHQPIQGRRAYRDRREDLEDHRFPARQAGQGRGLRADEVAADRGRLGDRQNLQGGGEVPPGADRIEKDAVPLRLR